MGNVLTNDSDVDGDPLTILTTGTLATAEGGTVVMAADGSFTYTPATDFHGTDSFGYTVKDGIGGTAAATVTLDVAPVNDAPVAEDDSFGATEDTALTGDVLANDSDPDGDVLTVSSVGTLTTAEGGTVVMAADGSFTYTPAADFNGLDSFGYTVKDGNGGTAAATVTLDVAAVNDAPVAADDAFGGTEDTIVTGQVLLNDSDPDGDTAHRHDHRHADDGRGRHRRSWPPTCTFTYTPASGFNGQRLASPTRSPTAMAAPIRRPSGSRPPPGVNDAAGRSRSGTRRSPPSTTPHEAERRPGSMSPTPTAIPLTWSPVAGQRRDQQLVGRRQAWSMPRRATGQAILTAYWFFGDRRLQLASRFLHSTSSRRRQRRQTAQRPRSSFQRHHGQPMRRWR